ncbi:MAG: metalloregulator ArsR/SmtB family transcription factor [Rhodobacteraceae bacterium]|nr:metalloregulator ArsR/SmtB family transcription factor [Paracoccaceae bacterium]
MESIWQTKALTALGHPGRLSVFRLLARRAPHGVRPGEMIGALDLKPSTLSVHLASLERAGLVWARRDGKSIYYGLALDNVGALVDFLVNDCCRGRPELCTPLAARALSPLAKGTDPMSDRVFNVLFICVGNSARSIMAEAILSRLGQGKFKAFSAGTKPYSEMNAFALEVLGNNGHDISGMRAKNVAEFQTADAPALDFAFTLCDAAANEECPPWPGQPITAHWGMPDPVKATGTKAERALAFKDTYRALHRRLSAFVALPIATLDRISLQRRLDEIGAERWLGKSEQGR